MGLSVVEFLGAGLYGSAWLLSDDTVLKITEDPQEVRNASAIVDEEIISDFLPRVYGVGSIPKRGVDFIIREKLYELDPVEKAKFSEVYTVADEYPTDAKELLKYTAPRYGMAPRWTYSQYNDAIEYSLPLVRAIYDDLHPYGVFFSDFHEDNIGKTKDGRIVILDLGAIGFRD